MGARPHTLTVDIGGTGIKLLVLDARGAPLSERARVLTPKPATPDRVLDALVALAASQPEFDRVTLGFPGVVRGGVALTAPNLDEQSWRGYDVRRALQRRLRKQARVINDADLQALAAVRGEGVELLLTLGTGVGAAWLVDGRLGVNLELGHHNFAGGKTYEQFLGRAVLDRIGKRKWRRRVARVVGALAPVFNYQRLYLGGGNAKHLDPAQLPADVTVVSNALALMAGLGPWLAEEGEAPLCLRAAGLRLHAPRPPTPTP